MKYGLTDIVEVEKPVTTAVVFVLYTKPKLSEIKPTLILHRNELHVNLIASWFRLFHGNLPNVTHRPHSAGSEETWLYCIAIRPGYNSVQRGDTGYRFLFSLGGVEETPG